MRVLPVAKLSHARWSDVWHLWRWRNDRRTRNWMRDTAPVGLLAHIWWFARVKQDHAVMLQVARHDGKRVGTCRLDMKTSGVAEVSITVAPACRGKGFARAMLHEVEFDARAFHQRYIQANIRSDNNASRAAFTAAGYVLVQGDNGWVNMEKCLELLDY